MSKKIFSFSITIAIILLLLSITDSLNAVQLLNTSSGIYAGQTVTYDDIIVHQYLGIEYAHIKKRFTRATPIRRQNDTIIQATSFGSLCKQTAGICAGGVISYPQTSCPVAYGIFSISLLPAEQCLFLNVFMPANTKNTKKKAIFMWIHGGSGQIGTGNAFDGTIFAAVGDVVVITFNFRLNLFGFLSSGDDRLEGNLGLYDQALVLDWIYENAEALGGDRHRITVGGHSAGAPHAYYLAVSPLNDGRIRRLILQSGSPFNLWSHLKAEDAMQTFNMVANDNGCGVFKTFDEKLRCLEERDFSLIAEYEHHSYTSANHTNVVLVGEYMSQFQKDFKNDDRLAKIEMLTGSADDEGVYVAFIPIIIEQSDQEAPAMSNVDYTSIALKFLSIMQPDKICLYDQALKLYHIDNIPKNCFQSSDCYCSAFYNYSRLVSDILFNNDYYHFIERRLQYSYPTYIYQYSHQTAQEHPSVCNDYLRRHKIVGHFAELEYTWGTPLLFEATKATSNMTPLVKYIRHEAYKFSYTDEQIRFSRQLIEHWSNFIKFGKPKGSILKGNWPVAKNMSHAFVMHLKVSQSKVQQFKIPPTVLFWRNECSIIQKNSSISIRTLSSMIFVCSLIFSKVFIVY